MRGLLEVVLGSGVDAISSVVLAGADWEPLSGDLRFLISFSI